MSFDEEYLEEYRVCDCPDHKENVHLESCEHFIKEPSLVCPDCGRVDNELVRAMARYDFECASVGCERHLSEYVKRTL